jgi:hypothetical protein
VISVGTTLSETLQRLDGMNSLAVLQQIAKRFSIHRRIVDDEMEIPTLKECPMITGRHDVSLINDNLAIDATA